MDLLCERNLITYRVGHPILVVHTPGLLGYMREGHPPRLTINHSIQMVNIMATQIKSISQANTQFKRNLVSAASAVEKSHSALVWAMLNAIETQDPSQLDTMHALVSEYWPTLVSRFNDYVLASIDGLEFKSGQYVDGGSVFALSECAVLATPWNTRDRLARDKAPAKAYDVRTDVKRMINKVAKCAAGKLPTTSTLKGANNQAVADILKKAQADIEAVYAGEHVAHVERVNNDDVVVGEIKRLIHAA